MQLPSDRPVIREHVRASAARSILEEEEDEYWEEEEIYEEVEGFEEIEHGLVREYLEQLNALPNEGRREQFREAVGDLFVRFNGMMAALEEAE